MRATALLMTVVFIFLAADSSEARRRRRKSHTRAKKRAVINEPDLYQRIGGSSVIASLVDDWVKSALTDGRLTAALGEKPAVVTKLKKDLNTQVCEITDGPCKLGGVKIEALGLPEEKFVVFADHLVRSMDRMHIREREKNELLGRLGEVRVDGPADASDDAAEGDESED